MSVSKKWVSDPVNVSLVLTSYQDSEGLTTDQIAERLSTTVHNILHVLKSLPVKDYLALKKNRYAKAKTGQQNPRWTGQALSSKGYAVQHVGGKQEYVHRTLMAEALGLKALPSWAIVHHIDGDKSNNQLSNLALTTADGHRTLHFLSERVDP
jgi:hypothetical protein